MSGRPLILVVDGNRANLTLLSQQLRHEGYEALSAGSLEEFDKVLNEQTSLALSLMDLSGFDQRIWLRCEELRKAKVPFIIISAQRSPTMQRDSMKHGASGLLVKPVGVKALMEYIHTLLGD
jgi:DNA-binding response OmpR family regulator